MKSMTSQGLRNLSQMARAMPVKSSLDMDCALSCLHVGSESRLVPPPSPTTLEHLRMYMVHLSQVLPEALSVLGNPANWRVERLLNPETMTLRRPKIFLHATINEHRTLLISWGLMPTVPFDYAGATPKNLRDASDFKHVDATWTRGSAPGHTIVRLTAKEHPSSVYRISEASPHLLEEDKAQREVFHAFLAALVGSLREVLDVEIEDWVEYDEKGHLRTVSVVDRVKRLAQEQHHASVKALSKATQDYEDTLQRAGVTADELERALTSDMDKQLAYVFAAVTGRKAHVTQLKACVRAYEPMTQLRELETHCRRVCVEAEAED